MGQEKRKHPRIPYTTRHHVAPYRGFLPAEDLFRPVVCHDISQAGFSYLSPKLPPGERIVLRLEIRGETRYIEAEVKNHRWTKDRVNYIIGCQFKGKLNDSATFANWTNAEGEVVARG